MSYLWRSLVFILPCHFDYFSFYTRRLRAEHKKTTLLYVVLMRLFKKSENKFFVSKRKVLTKYLKPRQIKLFRKCQHNPLVNIRLFEQVFEAVLGNRRQ